MNRWSIEQAQQWYAKQPWLVGCNFLPSSAVNQLEMFQAETYDPATIDKELGWAEDLGFNTMRVYLHDLLWDNDREGFIERLDDFLAIGTRHGIRMLLVLFDDCHRPDPVIGEQMLPIRGVHNCGWAQSPGYALVEQFHDGTIEETERTRLLDFVTGVITRFKDDERIVMWDLYNEPGGKSNPLLEAAWQRAWEVRPSQPLTACLEGAGGHDCIATNAANSDIITFHCYDGPLMEPIIVAHEEKFEGRPVVCTEYMARERGTTFQHSMPILKAHNVGAYNWGFVVGKSQTHFNWETVLTIDERREAGDFINPGEPIPEPELWFHDIVRMDGTPFSQDEIDFIKSIT
jgi:hypothetical protein